MWCSSWCHSARSDQFSNVCYWPHPHVIDHTSTGLEVLVNYFTLVRFILSAILLLFQKIRFVVVLEVGLYAYHSPGKVTTYTTAKASDVEEQFRIVWEAGKQFEGVILCIINMASCIKHWILRTVTNNFVIVYLIDPLMWTLDNQTFS